MKRIFLQIASYRDPCLIGTVYDAIEKAAIPTRLSFGICLQIASEDDIPRLNRLPNVRLLLVNCNDSPGLCWARSMSESLWDGEEFCLQVDSHMRFVQGWDELLLSMIEQCPSPKALLSAYLPDWSAKNPNPVRIGAGKFHNDLLMMRAGETINSDSPQLGMFICGHFLFAPAEFFREIPYDRNLYFIGEEATISARAWSHGWDIYHPNQVLAYHKYSRDGRRKHWEDNDLWWQKDNESVARCKQILGMEPITQALGQYGLGVRRTLASFESFTGVRFKGKYVSESAKAGIPNLRY